MAGMIRPLVVEDGRRFGNQSAVAEAAVADAAAVAGEPLRGGGEPSCPAESVASEQPETRGSGVAAPPGEEHDDGPPGLDDGIVDGYDQEDGCEEHPFECCKKQISGDWEVFWPDDPRLLNFGIVCGNCGGDRKNHPDLIHFFAGEKVEEFR